MAEEELRPIIIRRKIIKAAPHHGGAWKVAYADFVTAMMAFFLLMWLLNATTEDQRKGLADYFSPSIPVHRTSGGGDGPFGGTSAASEMTMSQTGTGATLERPSIERQSKGQTGVDPSTAEEQALDGLAEALLAQRGESAIADRLLQHVRLRRTDEGLVIEVADLADAPLFTAEGNAPTERLVALIGMIGKVLNMVENAIAVDGHLEQDSLARPGAPGWRVSSERAMVIRDLLAQSEVSALRFARVAGEADRAPAYADPRDIRNRRTEIILLRSRDRADAAQE
ncbi:flagellar motor protein MotB [Oceanibium sediminis]|uniref:flagellar motor protein MotB n=1 Tax=Oceanibium sediminis TaxID=2026339 RepID=UPI000DD3BD5C|nr:flagellar motor protein MotB [Oceanibium sediminis]